MIDVKEDPNMEEDEKDKKFEKCRKRQNISNNFLLLFLHELFGTIPMIYPYNI